MSKNKNMIPLKELNLTSRFLFDEVMEDPQAQQDMLSIIFGREIPVLQQNETEKEFRLSPLIRSVRMDIFSVDEEETVYNTEMHPAVLKDKVTSPAGSTIEGLAELESKGVRGAVISALYKAYEKTLLFSKK